VYNPLAIHKLLSYVLTRGPVAPNTFLQHHESFLNYDFHSQFSAPHKEDLAERLTATINMSHEFLKKSECLMLTYGTSWVYRRNDTGEVVANCHKRPSAEFTRSLLTHEEIIDSFEALYKRLKSFNSQLKIIVTLSPVRHIKDTLELNSVSKSIIRLCCHTLSTTHTDVHYFPAYEIMMDDLRDYRFYKSDLLHPSDVAEDYIWEKFIACYSDPVLQKFIKEWDDILAALAHKPFVPTSTAHHHFLKETLKKIEGFKSLVDVSSEINHVQRQLLSN
jgi:hypothetical protein